ncbi:uncharacterized protein BDZ99DRAFT_180188 [Mytilinidion resinicola]|uniref:Aminoglycoside phosphotransferase domain-containing protein n=1 Tax=Mytilinidion resinicola TaxID=574789 RepID=A0A6A6Z047_9PEZI|nr:uncharacterized protein BDZ99DRAFT_180188 [Mytilinidion resinicola]KAF2814556.1 hypothetical protein BDZ99DRAFT_180188 [Mytilinidion resinicola]
MLHSLTTSYKLALGSSLLIFLPILISRALVSPSSEMSPPPSPSSVASSLLVSRGLHLQSLKVIQSLWAGYGEICHMTASPNSSPNSSAKTSRSASTTNSNGSTPQEIQSFILKLITPPPTKSNDEGHLRKILSYQVEQYFYSELAPLLPPSVPVASCVASINQHHADGTSTTAMLLSDLRQRYPVAGDKRAQLAATQVHAALDWLSGFHGFWWPRAKAMDRRSFVRPPLEEIKLTAEDGREKSVWLNGGYTYLATRRKEYDDLASDYESEWTGALTKPLEDAISLSEVVADLLGPREQGWGRTEAYQTLIHGDVKSENLFTSTSGEEVAFYDFQYVGLGLGVCDLAKLFTCSVPLHLLVSYLDAPLGRELAMQPGEKALLERYLARLKAVSQKEYDWSVFVRHWETALVDWLRFQASWGFWGNTEWLEARVRWILTDGRWGEEVVGDWKHGQRTEAV